MVTQEELEKMSPEEIAQLQKDNCIFCKIIRGEIPSKKVYEDSDCIAILDINPAKRGHVLVMPKEHYPIMPLIPPEVFQKVFSATSLIAHGIRKAILVKETTIFIANGAVAGQQSPHFLFHIFPRDQGDILTNFELKDNPSLLPEQKSIEPTLKNALGAMLSRLVPSSGDMSSPPSPDGEVSSADSMLDKKQELIAQIIEEHADVRQAIIEDPDNFREQLKGNPQLEKLFDGVDLQTLSSKLKESFPQDESSSDDDSASSDGGEEGTVVFMGEDPVAQKDAIFEYFESKPKAKQLLIDDPSYFKELLESRPDIKDLFVDVNLDLLSKRLKEKSEGDVDV